MKMLAGGVMLIGLAVVVWRTVGFIRFPQTRADVFKASDIFASSEPRYRQTYSADRRKLRLFNPRTVFKRKSA